MNEERKHKRMIYVQPDNLDFYDSLGKGQKSKLINQLLREYRSKEEPSQVSDDEYIKRRLAEIDGHGTAK